jgi:hypothetical protein
MIKFDFLCCEWACGDMCIERTISKPRRRIARCSGFAPALRPSTDHGHSKEIYVTITPKKLNRINVQQICSKAWSMTDSKTVAANSGSPKSRKHETFRMWSFGVAAHRPALPSINRPAISNGSSCCSSILRPINITTSTWRWEANWKANWKATWKANQCSRSRADLLHSDEGTCIIRPLPQDHQFWQQFSHRLCPLPRRSVLQPPGA